MASPLDLRIDERVQDHAFKFWRKRVFLTENKHLSAVLEHIKAEQDKMPPKKKRAGKQRTIYEPTGRRNTGWNSLADRKRKAKRAAGQGSDV